MNRNAGNIDLLHEALKMLAARFSVTLPMARTIASNFRNEMKSGLAGYPCRLKMLPAFLGKPDGNETGTFLALDFGGTNIRLMLVELLGGRRYRIVRTRSFPLKEPLESCDYTSAKATGETLFDYIAGHIKDFIDHERIYDLGHTFSFPSRQVGTNEACLICWTKEIRTRQVEGEDVNRLLMEALRRNGIENVRPVVILNDTVSTLLAAAYKDADCDIGSICGTGHNTCYLERCFKGQGPMIINIESGNFDQLPFTIYDDILDGRSDRPGEQRLEKMVGGHYLGEIVRLAVVDFIEKNMFPINLEEDSPLRMPYFIKGEHLSLIMADENPGLSKAAAWCRDCLRINDPHWELLISLKTVAEAVSKRAAFLAGATYIGIMDHIGYRCSNHTIAVDGSLFEKMPGFSDNIAKIIKDLIPEGDLIVKVVKAKDASGLGAAVAAAMARTSSSFQ